MLAPNPAHSFSSLKFRINHFLQTLRECVFDDKKYHECSPEHMHYMIPFFCGQAPECAKVTEKSLKIAMENMDRNYLVVGLTEQMDDFFAVLQKIFPTYFTNITKIWRIEGTAFSFDFYRRQKKHILGRPGTTFVIFEENI